MYMTGDADGLPSQPQLLTLVRQKALSVELNQTPESRVFREFFGLPGDDFSDIHRGRLAAAK